MAATYPSMTKGKKNQPMGTDVDELLKGGSIEQVDEVVWQVRRSNPSYGEVVCSLR
jgi:hypothetical protein